MTITHESTIRPTDMIHLALAFQEAWESTATVSLTFRTSAKGKEELHLTVSTLVSVEGKEDDVSFSASGLWPNSGHSSLLAYIVWLLHNVDQQIDAYMHLLNFGAKPI